LPKILIVDSDLNTVEQLQQLFVGEGYEVLTAVTGQEGVQLAHVHRPSLVLLDVDLPDMDGYGVCRALRGAAATAQVPILIYSARTEVADKVAGFKAGANDYIVKPTAPAELVARVKAALRLDEHALAHAVALWGAKGGVGTTTVASNLAVALQAKTAKAGKRVALLDASVLGGTLGVVLNLAPRRTIADLLPRLDDLDAELLASVLATHSSGVRVLLSMPWSKDGDSVHAAQFERILDWLQGATDYVVVDTSPSLDEGTTAVLQHADQVIVVLTPEMTSLRNARIFFQAVESWGKPAGKFLLALNRYPAKGGIPLKDIEAALHRRVEIEIPGDEPLVTFSINRGIPLFMSHPRSPVAQGYARLAEAVVAAATKKQAGATSKATLG